MSAQRRQEKKTAWPAIFVLLMVAVPLPVWSGAIEMEALDVEGEIQKPEVLFIFDRSGGEPPVPGVDRLQENFLDAIVEDAWRRANDYGQRDLLD